jgi:hypothetical protein
MTRFCARNCVDLQIDASLRLYIAPRDQCVAITRTFAHTKMQAKNASEDGPLKERLLAVSQTK